MDTTPIIGEPEVDVNAPCPGEFQLVETFEWPVRYKGKHYTATLPWMTDMKDAKLNDFVGALLVRLMETKRENARLLERVTRDTPWRDPICHMNMVTLFACILFSFLVVYQAVSRFQISSAEV